MVDDLIYEYTGNRLTKVRETALNNTGYEGGNNLIAYDLNGNMTDMKDKGIQSIAYNYLSLSDQLSITQINPLRKVSNTNISHLYRADGTKLRKTYNNSGDMGAMITRMTDYLDGFQYSYDDNGTGAGCLTCKTEVAYEEQAYTKAMIGGPIFPATPEWKLSFIPTSEGFYSFTENRYIYQYKDHLGNVRVSFAKNSAGVLQAIDTNNFYPFGLNHIGGSSYSNFGNYYSYKYNGKELQETGMYDYGARFYMPDLGRWGVVDALAEQMRRHSPYNYAFNNPLRFIDPDGNSPRDTYGEHSAFNGDFDPNSSLSGYNGMGGSHGNYFGSNTDGGGFAAGNSTKTFGDTQAYRDLMSGRTSSITNSNGYFTYWTGAMSSSGSLINGEANVELELGVAHRQYVGDGPAWEAYKNMADWSSIVAEGGFGYIANQRTALYDSGYWIDNLGNQRSTRYAGRAIDSQIGLRSDYLRTTAKFTKYAERAGMVGNIISAGEVSYGIYEDGWKFGKKAQVATAGAIGGLVGAAEGALIGAYIGSFIPVPGAGTILGLAIGAGVGYIYGEIATQTVEKMYK
ncbi:RHS repeat-associated core domain-containing protein [Chryseobacterium lathyri]|uniref:RHS repeat-associated core domain-containing protein n=1 Tax=Chryseobacterium lathyri TaxID=395933 RepID=UPI002782F5E4|nr:RHS repeat-associated core domain-containing protein [Chryseobacterium lathyri]MDQ0066036.1 RHS repeat-associated protein [Chryseobacterium lathyri]